mgnify:CR=1 FL=1
MSGSPPEMPRSTTPASTKSSTIAYTSLVANSSADLCAEFDEQCKHLALHAFVASHTIWNGITGTKVPPLFCLLMCSVLKPRDREVLIENAEAPAALPHDWCPMLARVPPQVLRRFSDHHKAGIRSNQLLAQGAFHQFLSYKAGTAPSAAEQHTILLPVAGRYQKDCNSRFYPLDREAFPCSEVALDDSRNTVYPAMRIPS